LNETPAGLYLHVPFCSRICPYCDFAVRTGNSARRRRFVDHLVTEIELYRDYPLLFDTVYFGGGTPSILTPEDLARILETARSYLHLAEGTRTYLEANPEDVSVPALAQWRRLGIETLSLGVQSLDPHGLDFLGRRHTVEEALRAVSLCLGAGFGTVSVDLIYGRPEQSSSDWQRELDRAVALEAQHITCYQLTVHDRTRFGLLEKRGQLTQLPNDAQAELFRQTHRHLNASGYQGYEVSQFASDPAHRSGHNLKYWDHTPYLGLGPSAHSFEGRQRWWNLRRTDAWQDSVARAVRPVEGSETLDHRALALESLMLGFRTYDGVDLERVRSRWRVDLAASNSELIGRLESDGLISVLEGRLAPTLEGLAVADSLATLFVI
jgi:putative oxygen-independent coproporphyrinogen III oxidase